MKISDCLTGGNTIKGKQSTWGTLTEMKQVIDFLLYSDHIDIGFIIMDASGKVRYANAKMKTWYPLTEGQSVPEDTLFRLIVAQGLEHNREWSGIPFQEIYNGQALSLVSYGYLQMQHNEDPDPVWMVLLADIHALQPYLETRIAKERMDTIGNMAAGTANAILNPLAVIKGTLQLMGKSLKEQLAFWDAPTHPLYSKFTGYFQLLDDQIKAIDGSLQRFLLFGKKSELKYVPISVLQFLQELQLVLQTKALERQIRLAFEYPHRTAMVLGHPKSMREALLAVIDNAFEASPAGEVVSIRTSVTVTHVQFIIRDEGSGIPKEMQNQVLLPFVTDKADALGFGLSFSQFVVNKMGGALKIDSRDRGTTVTIQFPVFINETT